MITSLKVNNYIILYSKTMNSLLCHEISNYDLNMKRGEIPLMAFRDIATSLRSLFITLRCERMFYTKGRTQLCIFSQKIVYVPYDMKKWDWES